jgi:hypothetical protein
MTKIVRGSPVAFTVGQRVKFGTVVEVRHDHYRISDHSGDVYTVLHERVEALTDSEGLR